MKKLSFVVFAAFLLQACGGTYVADEYPLNEDRVSSFQVNGEVSVRSAYDEPHPIRITNLDADLQQISEQFAEQMGQEIDRHHNGDGGADKHIMVRVTDMNLANRIAYMEGRVSVELELGNGEQVSFERRNGSPGVIYRVLNGTIALAVIEALEDETVRAYLAE
ncbi:hypothetical protein J2T60_001817 [Natronospira proteinivora]|uniref:Uncharacterized protein n=1 Tax=Natronospira proteinivora TaxID=1807133 RepID=A0ABT1G932_9GAMM|nr:hypothetical protein [Natronospira proteinivora]MCP1727817.1 hypothetical protein [Natronospira proteinivora]